MLESQPPFRLISYWKTWKTLRLYQHVIVCYNDAYLYLIRSVGMAYTTEQIETNVASLRELPDIEKR